MTDLSDNSPNSNLSPNPKPNPNPSPNPNSSTNSSQLLPKSLENDLRQLLDDKRFFDISLKCSDNVILQSCKNILAVRTEVFNELIFDKSKKSANHHQQLEFDRINSVAMKLILEYLYTSKHEKETFEFDNIVEVYYSAIYFKLDDLQDDIIEFTKQTLRNGDDKSGKKLLSNFIEKFSLEADNEMGKILVDWVAKMQFFPDKADDDDLSLMGLEYLLKKTYNTKKQFGTYEITLFEYTLIKTKQIILEEEIGSKKNPYYMEYDSNVIEKIKDRLKPLLPLIDLHFIEADDIMKLEILRLFPPEMITEAYRHGIMAEKKNETINLIRGRLTFRWKLKPRDPKDTASKEGKKSKLSIANNGITVEADSELKSYESVTGDLIIKGKGIHKWDILVENLNETTIYIGICGIEEKFDKPGDKGFLGWALGSNGYVYNKKDRKWNNVKFKSGDVVSVTVDMKANQCFFGVNDVTSYEVVGHAFPDEVYPFVTLNKGCKLHIK